MELGGPSNPTPCLKQLHLAQVAESLSSQILPICRLCVHSTTSLARCCSACPFSQWKCFVLGFHRKFAHAMLVYCHRAPLRTVWVHPARWSWRQQQRCNKCGWCENTLITKKNGDTEHFTEEWVTRLSGMKRKFISGKFKLSIFKICYMSSCSTSLAIFCQETNQK